MSDPRSVAIDIDGDLFGSFARPVHGDSQESGDGIDAGDRRDPRTKENPVIRDVHDTCDRLRGVHGLGQLHVDHHSTCATVPIFDGDDIAAKLEAVDGDAFDLVRSVAGNGRRKVHDHGDLGAPEFEVT